MAGDIPFGSLGGQPIVSAATTLREFAEKGLDYSNWYRKANSYRCTIGPEPGVAWILMQQSDLKQLDSRQPQNLTFGLGNRSVVIKRLAIIQAQRLIPGPSLDPDALYLVQLVDCRWFLKRTYINERYNIRETCSADGWCQGTLRYETTPWTFQEICEDIWSHFSSFGGFFNYSTWDPAKFHEIASTVDPENIRFEGISAWDALATLCQQSGFFLRYDPTIGDVRIMKIGLQSDPFPGADGDLHAGYGGAKGALIGSASSRFALTPDNLTRAADDDLVEDAEMLLGSPMIPASINVLFPTSDAKCSDFCEINKVHGWYYKVNVTSSTVRGVLSGNDYQYIDDPASGTSVVLNSTTFARFTNSDDDTPDNQSDLVTLAEQIAIDYYVSIGRQATGRIVFGGVREYVPGPDISEVTWREWGDGMHTEVARWPAPVGLPRVPKLFTGGSGGGSFVLFEIVSIDTYTGAVVCKILYRPCGQNSVPDEDEHQHIEVWDPQGCLFDEADDDLLGRKGWAAYIKPDESVEPYGECLWAVFSLCCPD